MSGAESIGGDDDEMSSNSADESYGDCCLVGEENKPTAEERKSEGEKHPKQESLQTIGRCNRDTPNHFDSMCYEPARNFMWIARSPGKRIHAFNSTNYQARNMLLPSFSP